MNYQIGPWQFISNRCVITSNNLERELDPLLVKLLLHFISNPQQIVSRQTLIECVWQQSMIGSILRYLNMIAPLAFAFEPLHLMDQGVVLLKK